MTHQQTLHWQSPAKPQPRSRQANRHGHSVEKPSDIFANSTTPRNRAQATSPESKAFGSLREKILKIGATMWNKESDPMFFMYLDRLANAEKLKETDRIDARTALDDFIIGLDSIVHH